MRRVLCVWLPTFSTDLVKRRWSRSAPDAPGDRSRRPSPAIILTRPVASRELVARCCVQARAVGITEGMDLAHARPLLPERLAVHTENHRPARDRTALHALACWALRFSPLVAPDPPDGLLIDFTGTQRLHRGEARLIRSVAAAVEQLGFRARVAAASTFGCAWGVAHFGRHDLACVPTGREREAIEGLPVAALRIDDNTVLGLGEIAIAEVGHLLALPRAALASRFDTVLVRRLLQALGDADEHIDPVRPAPPAQSELLFDGPTDRWESVEAAARCVLEDLAAQLVRLQRGVRRLDIDALRPQAPSSQIQIRLSRPSLSTKHLWVLLRSRLERLDLGEGIEGFRLTAARTARVRHEQLDSRCLGGAGDRGTSAAWGELVDTFAGRFGAGDVVRIEPVESHLPERAFRERPAMEALPRVLPAMIDAERPTILFPLPEPADATALSPDGPILSLGWRGRRWNIVSCSLPERIGPEWWRWGPASGPLSTLPRRHPPRSRGAGPHAPPPPDRDYFAVQTEGGRWLWVCRHVGTARWFVHGQWS